MPELPEVEVLRRHLEPALVSRRITSVDVLLPKLVRPQTAAELSRAMVGSRFESVGRRGKYLLFQMRQADGQGVQVVGHLGMTGRMVRLPAGVPLPRHAAVVIGLGEDGDRFVFEDVRRFGRFNLETGPVEALGPEPLEEAFTAAVLAAALAGSTQAVKVRLLDQSMVSGVGNIYASEALFRAGLSPRRASRRVKRAEVIRLHQAIREVLQEAIHEGSTLPLDSAAGGEGLFYYGAVEGASDFYQERLRVYDRAGRPCVACGTPIQRIVQAARSTFLCPGCQR
jgi:formamidopyrimidine-DNA glycosylase